MLNKPAHPGLRKEGLAPPDGILNSRFPLATWWRGDNGVRRRRIRCDGFFIVQAADGLLLRHPFLPDRRLRVFTEGRGWGLGEVRHPRLGKSKSN